MPSRQHNPQRSQVPTAPPKQRAQACARDPCLSLDCTCLDCHSRHAVPATSNVSAAHWDYRGPPIPPPVWSHPAPGNIPPREPPAAARRPSSPAPPPRRRSAPRSHGGTAWRAPGSAGIRRSGSWLWGRGAVNAACRRTGESGQSSSRLTPCAPSGQQWVRYVANGEADCATVSSCPGWQGDGERALVRR